MSLLNFGWIDGCRSLSRSRILKFEKILDPDSNILEQERIRSLKKRIRSLLPPLISGESLFEDMHQQNEAVFLS